MSINILGQNPIFLLVSSQAICLHKTLQSRVRKCGSLFSCNTNLVEVLDSNEVSLIFHLENFGKTLSIDLSLLSNEICYATINKRLFA